MNWMDLEQERRRAERYQDLSRSACAIFVIALALVATFAFVMLLPEGSASWPR